MGIFPDSSSALQPPMADVEMLVQGLALPSQSIKLLFEPAGIQPGEANMSRDHLLLDEVRANQEPILIVRTYCWQEPTLSLGKHQPEKDRQDIREDLGLPLSTPLVTRPTGGRAILHGDDIAFAFITNAPSFLRLSLKDSYCVFTYWLKQTLHQLGYPTLSDCSTSNKDYLRSVLCFETRTPSDILSQEGKKLAGCAQARRAGGILQHGSAFLEQPPIALEPQFSQILFQVVQQSFTGKS